MNSKISAHILLVEDEAGVVDFIRKGLTEAGHTVKVAIDGESALKQSAETSFDIYILDIMLPDITGIEVCQKLRQQNIKSPILFLTALGTSENIALGLNIGADDYLVKPFKFIELNARINALLRRSSQNEANEKESNIVYKIADLELNDKTKIVTRKGIEITLTATEYRLLLVLLKNKGNVLSRMQLLEAAWDINYLRKKIDAEFEPKLIHTVVGMGYVIKEK